MTQEKKQSGGYGQFCPIARAAEVLTERWTPLVVRELHLGSSRFNDLQRGLPRMSSSLLSRRLKEMEHAGIVEIRPSKTGRGSEYYLSESGLALLPIIEGMGVWAQKYVRDDLVADKNLDPDLLMWDMRRGVSTPEMGKRSRFVVGFHYEGVPATRRRYWLVFEHGSVDVCLKPPGFDEDIIVACHIRTMVQVWLGHISIGAAMRAGDLTIDGMPDDVAGLPGWFGLSSLAPAAA